MNEKWKEGFTKIFHSHNLLFHKDECIICNAIYDKIIKLILAELPEEKPMHWKHKEYIYQANIWNDCLEETKKRIGG